MCGIFAYTGTHSAAPILLDGLRTLEYRGYDSAGIYTPAAGVVKAVGAIDNLSSKVPEDMPGTAGIAHTRWATHGEPTEVNAHPHSGSEKQVWIVHNGIIENFREIKDMLKAQGHTFVSDTDTEVLAVLIGSLYDGSDLRHAVQDALLRVRGTYGVAVIDKHRPEEVVVARMGSPIVLGLGTHGNFISSDPSALLTHTKDVVYLEDGEMAVITPTEYSVHAVSGEKKERNPETIEWDAESVQKGGYDHFMIKEIMEAPEVIENTIRGRLLVDQGKAKLGGVEPILQDLTQLNRLTIAACGSAYLAGYVGKYLLEEYAQLPVDLELASEYRYKTNIPDRKHALLAVTQSGETADTLAAVREAKKLGKLTLGIVNAVGSTIARETDAGVYNHAGPEVAVASTKAFISELVVFALLTLLVGREKGMTLEEGKQVAKELSSLSEVVRKMLADTTQIQEIAKKYAGYKSAMFIGRKAHVPIAFEGALKLKEVTYIHAEAYAGGELKHGSIALLDENFPVIALVPQDDVYEKMVSNIEEVKARKAPILAIANEGDDHIAEVATDVIYVPKVHPMLQPIVSAIPLHLLSYYVGIEKGLNVDRPRNLAKSVTVE